MDELVGRIVENLAGRLTGPLKFRLILQPAMAALLAIQAGFSDARQHRPAFFWAVISDASHRRELLSEGWKSIAKVFILAVFLDAVYQIVALRWVYPGEALIVGCILAIVPYLLLRGLINRIVRGVHLSERGASRS